MAQLVDVNGNPIDLAALREPQTARVQHLQREFDAHPARGLTPQRLHSIMVGAEEGDLVSQLDLADDMEERDAHLYAELSKRRGAITSQAWSIEPPDKATPQEEAITQRVRDWVGSLQACSNGMRGGMELVIATMCDAILKGFAPLEMVWDLTTDSEGKPVQLPTLTAQPQRWFRTSADRRHFLLRTLDMSAPAEDGLPPVMGTPLKPYAWLMHTHPARNGYLARMSLARVLFWPYLFKNYAIRDLAEFLEIYGLPLRLGKYPAGASDEEKRRLLQAVTQIGHNAAGIIPMGMALEFQAAAAGTEVPFTAMWDRMDAAESKAILGQTLTADQGNRGSQALGNVHNQVRMDIRDADARAIEGSFTRQVIQPLVALNIPGANLRRLPTLKLDTGEGEDLALYADALPKLVGLGLPVGVKWAQDKLRIPAPADGEAVLRAAAAPAVPPPGLPGAPQPADQAAARRALRALLVAAGPGAAAQADAIDRVVDDALADWHPLMEPMVAPLLAEIDKAVAAGESLAAFAARLPQLVERMDSRPLADSLARASFIARLAGEADLDLNPDQGA